MVDTARVKRARAALINAIRMRKLVTGYYDGIVARAEKALTSAVLEQEESQRIATSGKLDNYKFQAMRSASFSDRPITRPRLDLNHFVNNNVCCNGTCGDDPVDAP